MSAIQTPSATHPSSIYLDVHVGGECRVYRENHMIRRSGRVNVYRHTQHSPLGRFNMGLKEQNCYRQIRGCGLVLVRNAIGSKNGSRFKQCSKTALPTLTAHQLRLFHRIPAAVWSLDASLAHKHPPIQVDSTSHHHYPSISLSHLGLQRGFL